jgi:flavin reductase (DIM6/NTAB) family NADH-FMN oxidoreductase RutF
MNIPVKVPSIGSSSLRDAMRLLAGGVSVITAGEGDERTGLTVTTAVSLAVDPPTMIVCVNREASAWPVIRRYGHYCVNVLAHDQQHIADRFAGRGGVRGASRYENASWRALFTGALALEGALASIDCEVEEFIDRHSHSIIIGAVRSIHANPGRPLIYNQGAYGGFHPT